MNRMPVVSLILASAGLASAVALADEAPKAAAPAKPAAAVPAAAHPQTAQELLAKLDADEAVQKKPSGLRIKIEREGTGANPASTDTVKVNYRGTLLDGREFDSSYKRDTPATFSLQGVIRCWNEGLQLMKPGGKATLYCPPEIAYSDKGYPGVIPPGSLLTFEVELLGIEGAKTP